MKRAVGRISDIWHALRASDRGIGMVEVAVAIIVLGIILVAFLPLLVNSIELAVKNTAVAQANQILSSQLDLQRISMAGAPCTETTGPEPMTLAESEFAANRTVTCEANLATLSISVTSLQFGEEFASATTKVATG